MIDASQFHLTLPLGVKIYVAARFERQAEARELAQELVRVGYTVTSRWIWAPGLALGNHEASRFWSQVDLEDVADADVYLLLSDEVLGRGGKDFEGGYAYAKGKRIVVVGPPAHVFHYLPRVIRIADVATLRYRCLNGEKIDP